MDRYGNLMLITGIVVLAAAYLICMDERSFELCLFGFPLVDIGCGFLVLGSVIPSSILYRYKSAVFSNIAMLSYSIYLIHKITIHVTQEQFFKLEIAKESNLMMVICVLVTLIASNLLHHLIEKPVMKLRVQLLTLTARKSSSNMIRKE